MLSFDVGLCPDVNNRVCKTDNDLLDSLSGNAAIGIGWFGMVNTSRGANATFGPTPQKQICIPESIPSSAIRPGRKGDSSLK